MIYSFQPLQQPVQCSSFLHQSLSTQHPSLPPSFSHPLDFPHPHLFTPLCTPRSPWFSISTRPSFSPLFHQSHCSRGHQHSENCGTTCISINLNLHLHVYQWNTHSGQSVSLHTDVPCVTADCTYWGEEKGKHHSRCHRKLVINSRKQRGGKKIQEPQNVGREIKDRERRKRYCVCAVMDWKTSVSSAGVHLLKWTK